MTGQDTCLPQKHLFKDMQVYEHPHRSSLYFHCLALGLAKLVSCKKENGKLLKECDRQFAAHNHLCESRGWTIDTKIKNRVSCVSVDIGRHQVS